MRDFIITSLQSWNISIGSTIKNTALEIAKTHRVLYIDTPMNYVKWWKTPSKNRKGKLINLQKNLWVLYPSCPVFPVGHLPGEWLFDKINYINNRRIARCILSAVKELNFHDYIHIIDNDIYRSQYLKELIRPTLSIYYYRDFLIGVNYWKKNGARLEPLLAKKSDIVLANSSYFAERLRQYNPNTFTIESGVNLNLYDASQDRLEPKDLLPIQHPRIGYIGTLTVLRLDIELLYQLAKQMPIAQFVFVGPYDKTFENHPLHRLPNVHYLGKKEIEELPSYIQYFDVCINPQIVNDITYGNYPLKIDEYLAMGKPVVATSTHTMLDVFKEYTYLPKTMEEYIQCITKALTEINDIEKQKRRIAFAHTHTWENSIRKIYQAIENYEYHCIKKQTE